MVRSPVEICRGTSPSQAAKSRPVENTSPVPIAATVTLEMIGPMPGTVIRRSHAGSCSTKLAMSFVKPAPVPGQILDEAHHARRQRVRALGKDARQFGTQKAKPLAHRNSTFQ